MLASTATASARAGPARTMAFTPYCSSRLASSSALIAEISASTASICSPRRRWPRATSTRAAGTYVSRLRPRNRAAKYTYGPCGSPSAHRQPALPHRRVCSTSDPASTCSTSPTRPASARRRASSCRTGIAVRSFLCSLITQEIASISHGNQRPSSTRASVSSAASPSADSRQASGGSLRSVHPPGSVICPLSPPEQTNTTPSSRRLANKTSSRCPVSGWNGWVTTSDPKRSLDAAALCRLRRHAQDSRAPAMWLRDLHRAHRRREAGARGEPVPDLVQVVLQIGLELRDSEGPRNLHLP